MSSPDPSASLAGIWLLGDNVHVNVTVTPYDQSIYNPASKSAAGVCTWGAPCERQVAWTVIEHQADGVDSRWAACDHHNPDPAED